MRDKFMHFLSERFAGCRALATKAKGQAAAAWKKFLQLDMAHMLYIFIAADLLVIAVLVTVLLSHRTNQGQSLETSPEPSPTAAAATSELTPAPTAVATPVPSSTPTPIPKPIPKPAPTPVLTPPPITPPASGSLDPNSPSDIVLVTTQPVSDTDIPETAAH